MAQATSHKNLSNAPVTELSDREIAEQALAELRELRARLDGLAAAFTAGGLRGFRRALGGDR